MSTVSVIISGKGQKVLTIARDKSVFEAIQTMVQANVGPLIVTDGCEFYEKCFTESIESLARRLSMRRS